MSSFHCDTYSYSSVIEGSFGLHDFVELCKKNDTGRYYSPTFDSGRWQFILKFQFEFNPEDAALSVGIYLLPVAVGEEVNYNQSKHRAGKYTFTMTLMAGQNTIGSSTLTDITFYPKATIAGWGTTDFVKKYSVASAAPHHETVIFKYKITEKHPEYN
ncbi:hypothetical protein M422DRAFT_53612 [Sphaerobolus stellatus SS14]|uniref:MATH domain-containing protein n=1 Tax=Sphaerobolus stellatus (strain SS14) TaxID=990650 RepID=A0A0C9UZL0_SPHS4|nr:hypothetical protein M422DRAFT_53612 [Sphaerobolus stellatus SS14]